MFVIQPVEPPGRPRPEPVPGGGVCGGPCVEDCENCESCEDYRDCEGCEDCEGCAVTIPGRPRPEPVPGGGVCGGPCVEDCENCESCEDYRDCEGCEDCEGCVVTIPVRPRPEPVPGGFACDDPCVEDCGDCGDCEKCAAVVRDVVSYVEEMRGDWEVTDNGSEVVIITFPPSDVPCTLTWWHVVDGFLRTSELPAGERSVRMAAADFADGMHVVAAGGDQDQGDLHFIAPFWVDGGMITVLADPNLIREFIRTALLGNGCCACCMRGVAVADSGANSGGDADSGVEEAAVDGVERVEGVVTTPGERDLEAPVVSPNPVTGDQVRIDFPLDTGYEVRIYSPDMRLVFEVRVPEGRAHVGVDVSALPAGEYVVLTIGRRGVVRAFRLLRQ